VLGCAEGDSSSRYLVQAQGFILRSCLFNMIIISQIERQGMFEVGRIYKRAEEIHDVYGGQRRGGISSPAKQPFVFIFTGDSGSEYGYQDQFRPDGTFWYTGEGQLGDMEMTRGNLSVRDHQKKGKGLHLFEYVKKGYVKYIGELVYSGHHIQQRPDREGNIRNAIIFQLILLPNNPTSINESFGNYELNQAISLKYSLADLKRIALHCNVGGNLEQRVNEVFRRSKAIRFYALKRSHGVCEGCSSPAPFEGKEGPFLEVHHLHRLGDGGPDSPENVIALCPNCHRRVHYSRDGTDYNAGLIDKIKNLESEMFSA